MSLAACDTQETGMMQQQTITVHDPLIVIVTFNKSNAQNLIDFLDGSAGLGSHFSSSNSTAARAKMPGNYIWTWTTPERWVKKYMCI